MLSFMSLNDGNYVTYSTAIEKNRQHRCEPVSFENEENDVGSRSRDARTPKTKMLHYYERRYYLP